MRYPGLSRWTLNPMASARIRESGEDTWKGELAMGRRQRLGLRTLPQTEEHPEPPEAGGDKGGFPPRVLEGVKLLQHLDLELLASRTERGYIYVVLNQPFYGLK